MPAVVEAVVHLAAAGPAGEQHRANTFGADHRRDQRVLAPLLRTDELRAPIEERGRQLAGLRVFTQPVVVDLEPQLLVGEDEWLTDVIPVRDDAVRLDPVAD